MRLVLLYEGHRKRGSSGKRHLDAEIALEISREGRRVHTMHRRHAMQGVRSAEIGGGVLCALLHLKVLRALRLHRVLVQRLLPVVQVQRSLPPAEYPLAALCLLELSSRCHGGVEPRLT